MAEITQKQLDDFKRLHPGNPRIQALTLDEVLRNTRGKPVDWNTLWSAPAAPAAPAAPVASAAVSADLSVDASASAAATTVLGITPCELALGYVTFDAICLTVGAVGLRADVSPETIAAVARAAGPAMSQIEKIVMRMGAPGASKADLAVGVFQILRALYSGLSLGAVLSAILETLTWWDMVLYGITGSATVIAALATDGAAFVAEVVILLATFGFLVSDSVKVVEACG